MKYLVLALSLCAAATRSAAQDTTAKEETSRITIRIVEEKGGDHVVEERSYETPKLSPQQQRQHLDSLLGSLSGGEENSNRRVTITMEDGKFRKDPAGRIVKRRLDYSQAPDHAREWYTARPHAYAIEFDRMGRQLDSSLSKGAARMELKVNKFLADIESRPAEFNLDLNNRLENIRTFVWDGNSSNSSKTVRSVSINPNRPFDGNLNIRFSVKEKGDVLITVTDTRGKEQGKKELKDFEGEFAGQIRLKDSAKGVLFVNIVQNEDGVTQRVTLPGARSEDDNR